MPIKVPRCRYNLSNVDIKIGVEVMFDTEQVFTCTALKETRSGAPLVYWEAGCMTCGAKYETNTGRGVIGGVIRHCLKHRKARGGAAKRVEVVEKKAGGLPPLGERRSEAVSDWLTLEEMTKLYDECGADSSRSYIKEAKALMYQRQKEMLY